MNNLYRTFYSKAFHLFIGILYMGFINSCKTDNETKQVSEIQILTFNVLYTTSIQSSIDVINALEPDIIGLQESSNDRINTMGSKLNYYKHSFSKTPANLSGNDTGILSKFPIVDQYDDGVLIELKSGLQFAVFSVHLLPYPYEPYDFRDGIITTTQEAINSSEINRLPDIVFILNKIDSLQNKGIPVFLTGDFNEPSHLDWTSEAASKGHNFGKAVTWPVSSSVTESGLTDAFRSIYPDEITHPGITWTTIESANEVYDRIDYIYHDMSNKFMLKKVERVGGTGNDADIIVDGYASDHYAVLATYDLL